MRPTVAPGKTHPTPQIYHEEPRQGVHSEGVEDTPTLQHILESQCKNYGKKMRKTEGEQRNHN